MIGVPIEELIQVKENPVMETGSVLVNIAKNANTVGDWSLSRPQKISPLVNGRQFDVVR